MPSMSSPRDERNAEGRQKCFVGLFGGTFDPVHRAHIEIALRSQKEFSLDVVHFITAKIPPFKSNLQEGLSLIDKPESRYNLVKEAIKNYPNFIAARCELDREGISYSSDTVREYKTRYPNAQLFWITGEDAFLSLDTWHEAEYLKNNLHFIVFHRKSNNCQNPSYPVCNFDLVDFEEDISSSELRKLLLDPEKNLAKLKKYLPDELIISVFAGSLSR